MSAVGFEYILTFNQNGKVTNYQKSYTNTFYKLVKIYLPLNFNNKKDYEATLAVSINDTFPKQLEFVTGSKDKTDLNCYIFDVTMLYQKYKLNKKLGLSKIRLTNDNGRAKFTSESFRV